MPAQLALRGYSDPGLSLLILISFRLRARAVGAAANAPHNLRLLDLFALFDKIMLQTPGSEVSRVQEGDGVVRLGNPGPDRAPTRLHSVKEAW